MSLQVLASDWVQHLMSLEWLNWVWIIPPLPLLFPNSIEWVRSVIVIINLNESPGVGVQLSQTPNVLRVTQLNLDNALPCLFSSQKASKDQAVSNSNPHLKLSNCPSSTTSPSPSPWSISNLPELLAHFNHQADSVLWTSARAATSLEVPIRPW